MTDKEHFFEKKTETLSVQRIGTDREHFGDRLGAFCGKQKTGKIENYNHTRFEIVRFSLTKVEDPNRLSKISLDILSC